MPLFPHGRVRPGDARRPPDGWRPWAVGGCRARHAAGTAGGGARRSHALRAHHSAARARSSRRGIARFVVLAALHPGWRAGCARAGAAGAGGAGVSRCDRLWSDGGLALRVRPAYERDVAIATSRSEGQRLMTTILKGPLLERADLRGR